MPTFTTTTRWALRKLGGTNLVADVDAGFTALADDLDPKLTPHTSGLLAARPTSTVGTPGIEGRGYRATDTNELFLDTGTAWSKIPQGAVDLAALGLNEPGVARRGKSIIATTESRAVSAFGLMTTPDKVTVTLPTDGLIAVVYQATMAQTANIAAQAAIFLGANRIKTPTLTAPAAQASGLYNGLPDTPLCSFAGGLQVVNTANTGGATYTGDVTTGQVLGADWTTGTYGAPCWLFAAAGTYDVSVQFGAAAGQTVTVKNRRLWVWTLGF